MQPVLSASSGSQQFYPACNAAARILLVEDNSGDAELVRGLLEMNNIRPIEACHCVRVADAILSLQREKFSLIVLDLGLPDSQGLETLHRMREAVPTMPIIVLTGAEDLALSQTAIRLGAQDFLCKTHVSGELLARTICNAVERQRILSHAIDSLLVDDLTGLHNRKGLHSLANALLKKARQVGASAVLMYTDLDNLKRINDSQGHATGDCAIRETAGIMRNSLPESALLARIGGDEFAILAQLEPNEDSRALQIRLEMAVKHQNELRNRSYHLSLSIGVVEFDPMQTDSLDSLLLEADRRMYAEKRAKQAIVSSLQFNTAILR